MISELHLENFGCYYGSHTLHLDDGVYSVIARDVDDEERSNWLGKSTFLLAPSFILFGMPSREVVSHPFRVEDDWISYGKPRGEASMWWEDIHITRSRVRGKSTQLEVYHRNTPKKVLAKQEAQDYINRSIGLTEDDFYQTCFFGQKKLSHFVTCDPSTRMKTVVGWFKLEKLQESEEIIKADIGKLLKKVTELEHQRDIQRAQIGLEGAPDVTYYEREIKETEPKLQKALGRVQRLKLDADKLSKWRRDLDDAHRYWELHDEGVALRAEFDKLKDESKELERLESIEQEYQTRLTIAKRERDSKQRLSCGLFDGKCPVGGIECPVKDELNKNPKQNKKLLDEAEASLQKVIKDRPNIDEFTCVKGRMVDREVKSHDLDRLREQVARYKDAATRISNDGEPPEDENGDYQEAETDRVELESKLNELKRNRDACTRLVESEKKITEQLVEAQKQLTTMREALAICGRNGAQKRLVKTQLEVIEGGANNLLNRCAIPLSLQVKWGRETNGLAKACDECGQPFPKTTTIRKCAQCGAERGPEISPKLDIELSNSSGGAYDLVGGSFQLSASKWLRNNRLSGWDVGLIDEPFGALDASNRKAFANHLASLLRSDYGFRQAFIVAHHKEIMNALPRCVEITNNEGHATLKVM
jgi:DNA repair exonuclease SbcCD ATPase subunit